MSTPNQMKARDFIEEGKKRIVFLVICVVGLSYLMSLTSSSVWVNLPVATSLVVILRYLLLDFDMKRKAALYNSRPCTTTAQSSKKPLEFPKVVAKSDWREKVNSPVVEEAMDHFTRHLVSEWVTNQWYSRLTPDREGPEELVQIIIGFLGELSGRMRNINLIDLLMSDLINLICTHLEVFRATLAKIEKQTSSPLTIESLDTELKPALAAEDKLHPALFSAEAEHKVLQHLMEGLMSVTFKHEDLQCSSIRHTARELLVHAVMRPVLNLASPRFVNERIESVVINKTKLKKAANAVQEASHSTEDRLKISSDRFPKILNSSITGLELVQLGNSHSRNAQSSVEDNFVDTFSKDPLRSIDALLALLWKSLPSNSRINDNQSVKQYHSRGQWGDILDLMSQRMTQTLAPEHFENMWTKGRGYKNMDRENQSRELVLQQVVGKLPKSDHKKVIPGPEEKETNFKLNLSNGTSATANLGCSNRLTVEDTPVCADRSISTCPSVTSSQDDGQSHMRLLMVDSESSTSEDDETNTITRLSSPGTKVWDGRRNRNWAISLIHHPLENFDSHGTKMNKMQSCYHRPPRTRFGWKRSRSSGHNMHEVNRTSFFSGDEQDILRSPKSNVSSGDSSDDPDVDNLGRIHSGAAASSSASSISRSEPCNVAVNPLKSSLPVDSFFKLRCEVLGADIVKSGSRTFAVYSISVTDVNNKSWTIKRRFRHFEELHWRLKEFPDYNLHLPPKHFLTTGLDVTVVQERCKLLEIYLKLPIVSGSIEAWDFLSVDSQTYRFSNLLSIVKTLPADMDDKPSEKSKRTSDFSVRDLFAFRRENFVVSNQAVLGKDSQGLFENSGIDTSTRAEKSDTSPENLPKTVKGKEPDGSIEVSDLVHDTSDALPREWVPPNLSVPVLDLVGVIFQLQDGGWIRRKVFWVVKQILQLGMGDAFDDWLLAKIQLLRKGSVIASGIRRVEKILWPDGIFITKHPSRRPPPISSPSQNSPHGQQPKDSSSLRKDEQQKQEEDRRAKFVYELMIDHAPTAIVGLVGRKEYERCARHLYFFLQSSVCLKQLAFDIVELLMVTAFPELDYLFKQLHEEKHKFGKFNRN
ncbi:uncharacterized protein LOC129288193 isoform X2 [Prosopis cineraria]|uniref:uncharacterized protein LOC129288193 isoform X2 n=1 Tax=Prosopis cineraria TaxID=364024 RepID=UPI002410B360|nr:uncharacterized protein LOC129288193 isoform X2 [Prosopis cineraria]